LQPDVSHIDVTNATDDNDLDTVAKEHPWANALYDDQQIGLMLASKYVIILEEAHGMADVVAN
jgi:hypothetical protein